jgi:hypothetical protein
MLRLESPTANYSDYARIEAEKIYSALSSRELLTLLNSATYGGADITEKLREYFGIPDLKLLGLYRTWNELSLQFSLGMESMQSGAYIATRYFDFRVAEIGLRAAARGCTMNVIHSKRSGLSTKLQVLGNLMTHPKALGIFRKIPRSMNVIAKEGDLPFSFVVIDSKNVGIEIVNQEKPESFFLGVQFDSPTLASKLITYFNEVSKVANHEVDGLQSLDEEESKLGLVRQRNNHAGDA